MKRTYHIEITTAALAEHFSQDALEVVITANIGQDALGGSEWRPEHHFNNSTFKEGYAYMEMQRAIVLDTLNGDNPDPMPSRESFGCLIHAAQDFYTHSNYISLWLDRFPDGTPPPGDVEPEVEDILNSPHLRSGYFYPIEYISRWLGIRKLLMPLIPKDSHTKMNLDKPERGPAFHHAFAAALKRTRLEFERTASNLTPGALAAFTGEMT